MIDMERTSHWFDFFILYIAFFVYSTSSVFAKIAAQQTDLLFSLFFIFLEFLFLIFYALLWQQALKRFQLTIAVSNKGCTIIFSLLWSLVLFNEKITSLNILGSVLIIVGIWLVSADD